VTELSVVIPAWNEAGKIARDVEAVGAFMADEGMTGELIVVDDGSTDDTGAVAALATAGWPTGELEFRCVRHGDNLGKGRAVRSGVAASRGDLVLFADSGLCVPLRCALRGIELVRAGECELAHGSRFMPGSRIVRPAGVYRRAVSAAFRAGIRRLADVPRDLTDTQCGFKMYRGDVARELYADCVTDGFLFDIEVLLRAVRRGYRVREFPVEWTSDPDSRLRPLRALPDLLGELRRIKRALGEQGRA
jgi:dolichyl-phosphate beta-glucosyltransferase